MSIYIKLLMSVALLVIGGSASLSYAESSQGESQEQPASQPSKTATKAKDGVERVGGTYKVTSIKKKADDVFAIQFTSVVKTGRFDELLLESDHVHIGIKEGEELRLSAEVLNDYGAKAEVAQVLLFLPVGETHVPVWMLSRKVPNAQLRGSRFIEMHAPTSDYTIL